MVFDFHASCGPLSELLYTADVTWVASAIFISILSFRASIAMTKVSRSSGDCA
ncbi:MAG: hypothetical protein NTZ24_09680 [Deltaproteobacteria bacterium]|nr:hypothetical protein [Deltaproteobacteria bacterium]